MKAAEMIRYLQTVPPDAELFTYASDNVGAKHHELMDNIEAVRGEFRAFCKDRFADLFQLASNEKLKREPGDHAYWVHIQMCDVQDLLDTVQRLAKELKPVTDSQIASK